MIANLQEKGSNPGQNTIFLGMAKKFFVPFFPVKFATSSGFEGIAFLRGRNQH
jgi:hypothetical protein